MHSTEHGARHAAFITLLVALLLGFGGWVTAQVVDHSQRLGTLERAQERTGEALRNVEFNTSRILETIEKLDDRVFTYLTAQEKQLTSQRKK